MAQRGSVSRRPTRHHHPAHCRFRGNPIAALEALSRGGRRAADRRECRALSRSPGRQITLRRGPTSSVSRCWRSAERPATSKGGFVVRSPRKQVVTDYYPAPAKWRPRHHRWCRAGAVSSVLFDGTPATMSTATTPSWSYSYPMGPARVGSLSSRQQKEPPRQRGFGSLADGPAEGRYPHTGGVDQLRLLADRRDGLGSCVGVRLLYVRWRRCWVPDLMVSSLSPAARPEVRRRCESPSNRSPRVRWSASDWREIPGERTDAGQTRRCGVQAGLEPAPDGPHPCGHSTPPIEKTR
jgi:hypothetical protein